jgi:hypothetical protein
VLRHLEESGVRVTDFHLEGASSAGANGRPDATADPGRREEA